VILPRIYALALRDSALYVGGEFASMGAKPRLCLAAVDTATGRASDWDPGTNGLVWALSAFGNTLYIGGGFTTLGGLPCNRFAGISAGTTMAPKAQPWSPLASVMRIAPNPVRGRATARFAVPATVPVSLTIYDVQGRRVSTPMDHEIRPSGPQEVEIRTTGWPAGTYYCRLNVGAQTATQRLLVLP
jgi:hypothetical protein